jgi:hypothetical protein
LETTATSSTSSPKVTKCNQRFVVPLLDVWFHHNKVDIILAQDELGNFPVLSDKQRATGEIESRAQAEKHATQEALLKKRAEARAEQAERKLAALMAQLEQL